MATRAPARPAATEEVDPNIGRIIFASAAGTMIEWYDFYIFGSLAATISSKFYNTGTPLGDLIAWLAAFAVGFLVRPFGAIVFGTIGDFIGRKNTFLLTMTLMGLCTFAVGLLPTADQIGAAAGIILILLRILQGLALGGEYGGAATYIAEHAPAGRRGFFTSFIQITATAGLFFSLGVILVTRLAVGNDAFSAWGWRLPFLISIVLVAVSLYIRMSLQESPLFARLKKSGGVAKKAWTPLVESFTNWFNLKFVLLALLGATMGQGVVWYTGQFYALYYLQTIFKVPLVDSNLIIAIPLLIASPLFVVFGMLSDRIGRKPIMLGGMLLAVLTYIPIYSAMAAYAPGPNYSPFMLGVLIFIQVVYVTMVYGPIAAFLVELFPTRIRYTSMSLPYHIGNGVFGGLVPIIGLTMFNSAKNGFADLTGWLGWLRPIASFLVSITGARADIIAGLVYPITIATVCFIVGLVFIRETKDVDITAALRPGEAEAKPRSATAAGD